MVFDAIEKGLKGVADTSKVWARRAAHRVHMQATSTQLCVGQHGLLGGTQSRTCMDLAKGGLNLSKDVAHDGMK
eukprot:scaffold8395_cov21-Tisochrysis_lutea.AAC.1